MYRPCDATQSGLPVHALSYAQPVVATTHPLNSICPYYTMFPLHFPVAALRRAEPQQWVMDPFCGRGTTNLAARLRGANTVGLDSNPVAVALAAAKLTSVEPQQVMNEARELIAQPAGVVPEGEFWARCFHEATLREICSLRDGLMKGGDTPERVFLRAIVLGALHGPLTKSKPSYLSNQAPRTFAPKPRYAARYWSERSLAAPEVDTIEVLAPRIERYLSRPAPEIMSVVRLADSREVASFDDLPGIDWFVTSPPYYGMKTYLQDQWLRLWFLGGPAEVDYTHPASQLGHSSAGEFAAGLRTVWKNLHSVANPGARLILRFGGINDRSADPVEIVKESLRGSGWTVKTLRRAPHIDNGRRQVNQFGPGRKDPRQEYDVYCRPETG